MFSLKKILSCSQRYFLRKHFSHQSNVRLYTTIKCDQLQSKIIYPNGDKKLEKYLNYLNEQTDITALGKDVRILKEILRKYSNRKSIVSQYTELIDEMKNETNQDILSLVAEEKQNFIDVLAEIDAELLNEILELNDDENFSSVVLEVWGGVGGKEAMLFARELYEMYLNYMTFKQYDFNILQEDESDVGGLRHATILVNGRNSYHTLKNEAGVHRVQRVPKTENSGRIHTSTAVVAVLPCPDDIVVNINPKDLRIETKRASGPGGQNVNKLESAVRIVHIPSGISVECQEERTQKKNKSIAMTKLHAKLYQIELKNRQSSKDSARKSQVGTGNGLRNDKLRTYNYNQNRITDHRLDGGAGTVHNLEEFLEGGDSLDELICKIRALDRKRKLVEIVQQFA